MSIRKLYECQFALQGTEEEVEAIIKKICEISKYGEVVSFNITER